MTNLSVENKWEICTERVIQCKRRQAHKVMIDNISDLIWPPLETPNLKIRPDFRNGRSFHVVNGRKIIRPWGTTLMHWVGGNLSITDAIINNGPGHPSSVIHWSFETTRWDDPRRHPHASCTYTARIQHFSEDDYQRNVILGIERKWPDAADRFVSYCNERARFY